MRLFIIVVVFIYLVDWLKPSRTLWIVGRWFVKLGVVDWCIPLVNRLFGKPSCVEREL